MNQYKVFLFHIFNFFSLHFFLLIDESLDSLTEQFSEFKLEPTKTPQNQSYFTGLYTFEYNAFGKIIKHNNLYRMHF
jgi:hypothetical protein